MRPISIYEKNPRKQNIIIVDLCDHFLVDFCWSSQGWWFKDQWYRWPTEGSTEKQYSRDSLPRFQRQKRKCKSFWLPLRYSTITYSTFSVFLYWRQCFEIFMNISNEGILKSGDGNIWCYYFYVLSIKRSVSDLNVHTYST